VPTHQHPACQNRPQAPHLADITAIKSLFFRGETGLRVFA